MGIADNFREEARKKREEERERELKRDEAKECFNKIIKECGYEANAGHNSFSFRFPGYNYCSSTACLYYTPPIESITKMLKKEGFKVKVKQRDILRYEVYGSMTPWLDCFDKKERQEIEERDNSVVGKELYLEIEW